MQFQIIDWYSNDFDTTSGNPLPTRDDPETTEYDDEDAEFKIIVFGKMIDGKTIAVHLTGFRPYFFVEFSQKLQDFRYRSKYCDMKKRNKFKQEVKGFQIINAHKFYGFTNKLKFKFLKIRCKSLRSWYKSISYFRYNQGQLYESNIHPLLRVIHIQDLDSCGVAKIEKYQDVEIKLTTCDIELECKFKYISKVEDDRLYPIKICSFDIECSSIDNNSFPKARRDEDNIEELKEICEIPNDYIGDSVTQIGITTSFYGSSDIVEKHIICLKKTDDIKGACVEWYKTEKEVLLAFSKYIQKCDPDIFTGYNIFGFDFKFLYQRADVLNIISDFSILGRLKNKACPYIKQNLSSSALGNNILTYFNMYGRIVIDMMKVVMRDHKLINYKLETVAKHFLNVGKNKITIKEIFQMIDGTSRERQKVAKYCIQDCALCNRLMDKLDILPNNMNMANVCSVPLSFIFFRGQTIKVFSLIAKECRKENYLIKVLERKKVFTEADKKFEKLMNSYKGSFVLEPTTGFYKESPIVICDFSSLYPSCMIAENLSQDTLVNDAKYDNLPGVIYQDKIFLDSNETEHKCRFVKYKTDKDGKIKLKNRGILPRILIKLLGERKHAKKQMKLAVDPFQKKLFNGKQLALKVTCNSVYGFCGAGTSQCHCRPIAGCTTTEGRNLLMLSKNYVEKNYPGSKCIYGDSVLGDEPVIIKDDIVRIVRIDSLVKKWIKYGDKEIGYVNSYVWSQTGWNKIQKVIRHKVNKKIYRVRTDKGIVSCTEDHSLLDTKGNKIKPLDSEGIELLHKKLPKIKVEHEFSDSEIIKFAMEFNNS